MDSKEEPYLADKQMQILISQISDINILLLKTNKSIWEKTQLQVAATVWFDENIFMEYGVFQHWFFLSPSLRGGLLANVCIWDTEVKENFAFIIMNSIKVK